MPPVRDGGLGGLGSPRTTPHGALHSAAASPRRRTGAWAQTQGQLPHCFIPCFQGPVTVSPLQRSDPALKINNVLTHTANPNEAELPRRGGLPREPAVTGAGGMSLPTPTPGCRIGVPSPGCDPPPGLGQLLLSPSTVPYSAAACWGARDPE